MRELDLLGADTIDSMVWDIMNSVKADAKMLEDKYDETDEYQYYQDAEDLRKLIGQLERVTDHICGIVREYRP